MYLHEPLYSPTMFHGRCTTCTAPDDIWTDTRAMLDMKSDDFLEKTTLHNFTMEDAIIKKDALNHIKINTKRLLDFQKSG